MEENTVKSNVVGIRPGTVPTTSRERELVEFLIQKIQKYREDGVEVDSIMLVLAGKATERDDETKEMVTHDSWLGYNFWVADDRPTTPTLSYMTAFMQRCLMDHMYSD